MLAATRRSLLGGAIGLAATGTVVRASNVSGNKEHDRVIPLWPGTPPGGAGVHPVPETIENSRDPAHPDRSLKGIARPELVVKRAPKPNGAAIMAIPGGGYQTLSWDNEGIEQAAWLNRLGITTFILRYRLPDEGWADRADVPLQDGQRAMRLIRANARRFGIDPQRVGILGFSAGGHLGGMLATRFDHRVYQPVDDADSLSARPDLAGLLYPVITMRLGTHGGTREALLGPNSSLAERDAYSVDNHVTSGTPPVFLCFAGDDPSVPAAHSLRMYQAMLEADRPVELHAFEKGGHGFGVRLPPSVPTAHWPELFATFARYHRLLA